MAAQPMAIDPGRPRSIPDLRSYLRALEEAGELERVRSVVSIRDLGRLIEASDRAVLFESVAGYSMPVLANAMASRRRLAMAFGCAEADLRMELARRLERPVAPVVVDHGPVQEVVVRGEEADLSSLPAYLQHDLDAAPYLSAAMDVSRHPETGRYNIGVRRLMLRGPRETGVDVVAPSDLRAYYRRARELGRRFEIAFVIGTHPLDYLASQMRVATDNEFEVLGAVRGFPVELVRCATVGLMVPADAELVLEGYLEGDWTEVEGPYGEYTGCYGAAHFNPVFKLTGLMRRRDAIFQSVTISGRRLFHTDSAVLGAVGTELAVAEAVGRAVPEVLDVYCPPEASGFHHVRIAIRARQAGDARNALSAALAATEVKLAVVVDEDIDVRDDRSVEWALSTRFQADRDLVVLEGMRCIPLDPSLPPHQGWHVTTAKLGIDATRRHDKPAHVFAIPAAPFEDRPRDWFQPESPTDQQALRQRMEASLSHGPRFLDWLEQERGVPQAQIVQVLGALRAEGRVRLDPDGRYWPAEAPPSTG
jgi:2,5-furandicarboxylate decarboxylase 1